jgi:shikimate kinase
MTELRIFLVGPMGSGKTTIGRRVAKSLRKNFVDADQELERRTGGSVALIFDVEGEVLDADNRKVLSDRGFVIYLHALVEELVERTRHDTNRPLLNTDDPVGKMRDILEQRDSLYRSIADLVIDTGTVGLTEVVRQIRMACK